MASLPKMWKDPVVDTNTLVFIPMSQYSITLLENIQTLKTGYLAFEEKVETTWKKYFIMQKRLKIWSFV